jgi:hypothetical protein
MATLVVSDLHLGSRMAGDVARFPAVRAPLLEAAARADEVLILGDAVELRERPPAVAMEVAQGFFADLGEAVGASRVTIVPGNHDHVLIGPWLERRRRVEPDGMLGLEQRVDPAQASEFAQDIARWMPQSTLEIAYPGVWLRDDVYALHGHYLDRHLTMPSIECLGTRAVERFTRSGRREAPGPVEDYEAVFGPVYAWLFALARESRIDGKVSGAGSSHAAWEILVGDGSKQPLRHRALARVGFPVAVAALRAAGLGPLSSELSGTELRRACLRAIGEVLERLEVTAPHVIFGHTHRSGPYPGDDAGEWRAPTGSRLINTGSWTFEPRFAPEGQGRTPYWPGMAVTVGEEGPPQLRALLSDASSDDLQALRTEVVGAR